MNETRLSAIFERVEDADRAVVDLRRNGVRDEQLSFVSKHSENPGTHADGGGADTTAERAGKGLLAGAGAGALFGLAALAIPGVGPFITAGFLAEALGVTGGAIAAGALVGGTSGALAGALTKAGYSDAEARYYGDYMERGGVLVVVDTVGGTLAAPDVMAILERNGGRVAQAQADALR